jgi:zinc protease
VSAFQNSGRVDGRFQISVTPKPGQTPARMAALVNEELTKVIGQGITPRELERAQHTIRAQFLDGLAGVLGKADQLSRYNYFVGTPDYVQQDAARYDRVTAADVQRVARTYLGAPRVVLTVVPEGQTAMMVSAGGAR